MFTLFIIIVVIFSVFMGRRAYKQEEVIEGNRSDLVEKRHDKMYGWGVMFVLSAIALLISYFIIDKFFELEYTTVENVWLFGDVEIKHNTSAGNWSLFLSIFGWIMGPLSIYWFISNWEKYDKYKSMTDEEFYQLQQETFIKYNQEQTAMKNINKAAKVANKGMKMYNHFNN